jgi:hypothetical protein
LGAKPLSGGPHTIRPAAVYTVESATKALGLNRTTLKRKILQGRLRRAPCGTELHPRQVARGGGGPPAGQGGVKGKAHRLWPGGFVQG